MDFSAICASVRGISDFFLRSFSRLSRRVSAAASVCRLSRGAARSSMSFSLDPPPAAMATAAGSAAAAAVLGDAVSERFFSDDDDDDELFFLTPHSVRKIASNSIVAPAVAMITLFASSPPSGRDSASNATPATPNTNSALRNDMEAPKARTQIEPLAGRWCFTHPQGQSRSEAPLQNKKNKRVSGERAQRVNEAPGTHARR